MRLRNKIQRQVLSVKKVATSIVTSIVLSACQQGLDFTDQPASPDTLPTEANSTLNPGNPTALSDSYRDFQCKDVNSLVKPRVQPLRRLSRQAYMNTVRDLLGMYIGVPTAESFIARLQDAMNLIPADENETFDRLDLRLTQSHYEAYWAVATGVADLITKNPAALKAIAGQCASDTNVSETCARAFIQKFAPNAMRRPINMAQLQSFLDFFALNPSKGIRDLIVRFLMSPEFIYHIEYVGEKVPGTTNVYKLDPYELASRLSYQFWESMPNEALFQAAANGRLEREYAKVVDEVFLDEGRRRTEQTFARFYRQWLKLEKVPFLNASGSKALEVLAQGEQITPQLREDMINEVNNLTHHYTWNVNGRFEDLLTSELSFAESATLAKLYGVAPWQRGKTPPKFPAGERAGLLNRAALLVSGTEETNPIVRGAHIRRDILCDSIAAPDPNVLANVDARPPATDPAKSTRQRFTDKTAAPICMSCHTRMNNLGFALEHFDALGRARSLEFVYDDTGGVRAVHAVDANVNPMIEFGDSTTVASGVELSHEIAKSGKAHACFVRQYFRYTFSRQEDLATDGCTLNSMYRSLTATNGGIRDLFKQVAFQPEFRLRKIRSSNQN